MNPLSSPRFPLTPEVCVRAIEARDPRFDGVFFVGITSTRIYCRPVCPARVSRPANRRFFRCAAAAEAAGFRPCRRCRPELAPGRALVDAVSRLAFAAERRIAEGALNGRPVRALARELCVGERHLRRALERELGVSPVQLAQTHRLLLAKRLLTDTRLRVSQVAYASGFQSLRRFNALFRECYGMTPTTLRRRPRPKRPDRSPGSRSAAKPGAHPSLGIGLAYRSPFNWATLLDSIRAEALPGVEMVSGARYARTVSIDGHVGVVMVEDRGEADRADRAEGALEVELSLSLLPALMPLIARLRHTFDLDAEPTVIEGALAGTGLADLVRRFPGVRVAGAFDGFELGLGLLLREAAGARARDAARSVVARLGAPVPTDVPGLAFAAPTPLRIAEAEEAGLVDLGVSPDAARAAVALARAVLEGRLDLRPGSDAAHTFSELVRLPGFDESLARKLIGRTVAWPDHFDASDRALQRAMGTTDAAGLQARAESWRPWGAYAARLLRMDEGDRGSPRRAPQLDVRNRRDPIATPR
jgi:AraC family transcriptional regulator, regulatory protein of adaptative response / DNA-3-methyladenine glycosylase II